MYHIVYLTTNLVNQKIYVGVHSTHNLDDGYLGSGKALIPSIRKYGKDSFKRETLYYCLSDMDAYELEKVIVDGQFVKRRDTYNIRIGGNYFYKGVPLSEETRKKISVSKTGVRMTEEVRKKMALIHKNRVKSDREREISRQIGYRNKGKKRTDEQKARIKASVAGCIRNSVISDETKNKLKESSSKRCNDPNKNFHYTLKSPSGEVYTIVGNLKKFATEHNLSYHLLYTNKNRGPVFNSHNGRGNLEQIESTVGWSIASTGESIFNQKS